MRIPNERWGGITSHPNEIVRVLCPIHSTTMRTMSGQGSTGNVICALASFLYPGLGQLFQGRILAGAVFFFAATILWFILLGWIMHIWATVDAALFRA